MLIATSARVGFRKITWMVVVFIVLLSESQAKKIALIEALYAGSTERLFSIMGEAYLKEGHDVTMIRFGHSLKPIYHHDTIKIYNFQLNATTCRNSMVSEEGNIMIPTTYLWEQPRSFFTVPWDAMTLSLCHCKAILPGSPIFEILKREAFDIAVVDIWWNECSLALTHHLNVPAIGLWTFPTAGGEDSFSGALELPSVTPIILSELTTQMSFIDRMYNVQQYVIYQLIYNLHYLIVNLQLLLQYPSTPPVQTLLGNLSALFYTVYPDILTPKATTRNIIELGCLSCYKRQNLTQEYKDFFNDTNDTPVILAAFGLSGFSASEVPMQLVKSLQYLIDELDAKFIAQFDSKTLPNNHRLMTSKFLPQNELLAHEKTSLFISHCGVNSVMESIFNEVPILCVPVTTDEGDISVRILSLGVGEMLDKSDLVGFRLYQLVEYMLRSENYERYKTNLKKYSCIWKERPLGPEQLLIHSTNQIIKYGSLSHLQLNLSGLNILQFLMIDIFMAYLLLFCVMMLMLYYCIKTLSHIIFHRKKCKSE